VTVEAIATLACRFGGPCCYRACCEKKYRLESELTKPAIEKPE
jgi:hypothetical protein